MTQAAGLPGRTQSALWPELRAVDRGAMRELLIHGPRSRAEIARSLGMSRASLTRVTRALVDEGLVIEGGAQQRGFTGRPGELLHVRPEGRSLLGIKLTGTRLYAVVTDLLAEIRTEVEEPLTSRAVEDVVAQIGVVHQRLTADHPNIAAAGIALAGETSSDRSTEEQIIDSPFLDWRGVPLARLAGEELGIPVSVENDVRCLTAAEHWFGVGAGLDSMVLLTVGVGIGFGFVIGGEVVTGAHGRAGRLDHLRLEGPGPRCVYCHRHCVSSVLTNNAIVGALRAPGLDYEAVLALARDGDAAALRTFREAGHALGVLVALLADTFDPEKIVITGDGVAVAELARDEMDAAVAEHRDPSGSDLTVDVEPFTFDEWARAGAVLALRDRLSD